MKLMIRRTIHILIACTGCMYAQAQQLSIHFNPQPGSFPLIQTGKPALISFDCKEPKVVELAAAALGEDINDISGNRPYIQLCAPLKEYSIIIGTLGHSGIIDSLVRTGGLDAKAIKGKWEASLIALVDRPATGCRQALVIAGSDPRGTAFGVFELSKMLGVSPWKWWADVHPERRTAIYIRKGTAVTSSPAVKYRGIFLNDEDWGLRPWAGKTFEPESGNIGPKTYAKIFELLLRLKANLIWPAMHPGTAPFFSMAGNNQVAADYAIIVGSSHAEPMLRNNVGEWDKKTMGDFNYRTNKANVLAYWKQRVEDSKGIDAVYTLGMRGIHDSGMEGVKTTEEAITLLDTILKDQRTLLTASLQKDSLQVPQVFIAYKEVLDIYDKGLRLPDDVTLVWPDDNYGYIQRLSNANEQKRKGGSGIYYHASYWGRPHDYLWLGTTHPGLIRQEMIKAFNQGADRLWVLNVGDIKPLEYNIQLFMDMAYDPVPFENSRHTKRHLRTWVVQQFGTLNAAAISDVLWSYYGAAFERRPEFMGWSQTEPTTGTKRTGYQHLSNGDEAGNRIKRYEGMEQKVKSLYARAGAKQKDAFYQLVYYPVMGASLMNKKFLYLDKAYLYGKQGRISAADYAHRSMQAYRQIEAETKYYNEQLSGGKWKGMMSMTPRDLPVFGPPVWVSTNQKNSSGWQVIPENFATRDSTIDQNATAFDLPAFDRYGKPTNFMDLFLTGVEPVSWSATPSQKWIRISRYKGLLDKEYGKSEIRLIISIDWQGLKADSASGYILLTGNCKTFRVHVWARNMQAAVAKNFKGYVESGGIVSILATGFQRQQASVYGLWKTVHDIGYTGTSMSASVPYAFKKIDTQHLDPLKNELPFLSYDFYTFTSSAPELKMYTLPTHPLNNEWGMRYAFSIDDGPLQMVDFRTVGRSEEWKQNVLRNNAVRSIKLPYLAGGKHRLTVYMIDPGVVLDRALIIMGGNVSAYSVLPSAVIK